MPRVVNLRVDRSRREYAGNARCEVFIDPEVLGAHGLAAGAFVRLSTFWGKTILGRVGEPIAEDAGTGIIRLDRLQRQALKSRLLEEVEVHFLERLPPVAKIRLQAGVDLTSAGSHHIEDHLREFLLNHAVTASEGMLLHAHFHHSAAGALYRVNKVEPEAGIITPDTKVILDPNPAGFADGIGLDATFEDVGGLGPELELVRELVQLPLQLPLAYRHLGVRPPRGIIFYGPPGTGKTHLARALANEIDAQFYYINGPDIVGTMYGETEQNLRDIFGEASHHAPAIILIDELDALAPKRGGSGAHSDVRMVTQLLSLMDGLSRVDGVVVIGTTNRLETLDIALRRPGRFDRELYFGPPSVAGREEILRIHTREMPLSHDATEYIPELAAKLHGFVGADIQELCREAALSALRRSVPERLERLQSVIHKVPHISIRKEDFVAATRQVRPSAMREAIVQTPQFSWADCAGLEAVKGELERLVRLPLEQPERARELGFDGILLSGPPGTGKTLLAHGVAEACGVNFLAVRCPELFSKWLGDSEEAVRHVFRVARQLAPVIAFFDQLDALAAVRSEDGGLRTNQRMVSQLLLELDAISGFDRQVVVLAATNRIDLLDPAVMTPGRLGTILHVALPSSSDREAIAMVHLRGVETPPGMTLEIARRTEGGSGADVRRICQAVKRSAFFRGRPDRIEWEDLEGCSTAPVSLAMDYR